MPAPNDWKSPLAFTSERIITFKNMVDQTSEWSPFQQSDYFCHALSGRFIRLEYGADGWSLRVQGAADLSQRFIFVEADSKRVEEQSVEYLTIVDREEQTLNKNGWAGDLLEMEELFGAGPRIGDPRKNQTIWNDWKLYRHNGDYRYTPRTDLHRWRHTWWRDLKAVKLDQRSEQSSQQDLNEPKAPAGHSALVRDAHRLNTPRSAAQLQTPYAPVPRGESTSYQHTGGQESQRKPVRHAAKLDRFIAYATSAQGANIRKWEVEENRTNTVRPNPQPVRLWDLSEAMSHNADAWRSRLQHCFMRRTLSPAQDIPLRSRLITVS